MSTLTYSVSKVMNANPTDVFNHFKGSFQLEFPNGEIITSTGLQLAVSLYAWQMHKVFPNIPLLPKYHISKYQKDPNAFGTGTFLDLMSDLLNEVMTIYSEDDDNRHFDLQSKAWGLVVDILDKFRNDVHIHAMPYRPTLNIDDALEILLDKEILKIDEENPLSKESILNPDLVPAIYKMKGKRIRDFKHNNITRMLLSGVIKEQQLMQCIGPRGFVGSINYRIFPEPISCGYLHGMNRIHDMAIESRTAAMSLNNQTDALETTEHLSRCIQLMGSLLENVHRGDCGTKKHLRWRVRPESSNRVVDDLTFLEGMNYLDEETGKYRQVKRKDVHLIGKTIKLRTILGCCHPDPSGVCSTCFGHGANSIARFRNLGHASIISIMERIAQDTLSTKHLTTSAVSTGVYLSDLANKYFRLVSKGTSIGIRPEVMKVYDEVSIMVPIESFDGLNDIVEVSNINEASPRRTSSVHSVVLHLVKGDEHLYETIGLTSRHDESYFSMSVLKHMRQYGWTTSGHSLKTVKSDGLIEINLAQFNVNNPIVEVTAKQFNLLDLTKSIKDLLRSPASAIGNVEDMSPETFLMTLADIITERMGVNMSALQSMAYTMLCVNPSEGDYSLPKPWTKQNIGKMDSLARGRSISGALSYERQAEVMRDPNSYLYTNRPHHPMDEFFTPEQMNLSFHEELVKV